MNENVRLKKLRLVFFLSLQNKILQKDLVPENTHLDT